MSIKKVYFQEVQRQSWLIWLVMLIINLIFIFGSIKQIGFNEQFGDKPMSDISLLIVTVIIFLFSFSLTVSCKLVTIINDKGVFFRYYPFHWRFKYIDWKTIDKLSVVRYNPLLEYGGWGFRKKRRGAFAYTIKGRMGLLIDQKNSKSILIGTQRSESLKDILTKLDKDGAYLV